MRKYCCFIIVIFLPFLSTAQTTAEKALQIIDEKYPQEKVHLFFNKDGFVAGETVWFKGYVFSGSVLSLISTNLYVELYNDQKQLLDKQIIPIIGGVGQGGFSLPAKLSEGVYHIRSYTRWMLNFDESFHYFTQFPVYNLSSTNRLEKKPVQWTAQAFAESGILLAGQDNKIAVRLNPIGILPDSWSAYVFEKRDPLKKLSSFSSFNSQLGSFLFMPASGNSYQLHITDNNGNTATIPLPSVQDKGIALRAEQTGDQVYLELVFKGMPEGGLNHRILAHVQNEVVFNAFIRKKDEIVKASVPVGKLTTGIMHLTIFDDKENAVAERLVFIDNGQPMLAALSTDTLSKESRQLNHLNAGVDTMQSQTYAVSVVDAGLSAPRTRSIYSDLWLGDLKGNIHQPNWYFTTKDPNRFLALDALMLTEKWERTNWRQLVAGQFPKISFQPEKYLSFFATATRFRRVIQDETLNLMIQYKDSSIQLTQVKTDKLGSFQIVNAAFYDTVKVFFQSNVKKGAAKDVDVSFEPGNFFKTFTGTLPPTEFVLVKRKEGDAVPAMVQNALDALKLQTNIDTRFQEMEGVVVEARKKTATQKLNEELTSSLFNTDNEFIFDFLNEDHSTQAYSNVFQFLEGRVPGLNFSMTDGVYRPIMRDGVVSIFIDEIETDVEMINSLPISQIAMVKVIRGYFLGGMSGGGGSGAIAIYTNRGGLGGKFAPSGMPSTHLVGYRDAGEYRHFNYADEMYRSDKTDTRDNLFWSVNLYPDRNGYAPIRFYNNDVSRSYRVIVTGFTKDARPVYEERTVKIRE